MSDTVGCSYIRTIILFGAVVAMVPLFSFLLVFFSVFFLCSFNQHRLPACLLIYWFYIYMTTSRSTATNETIPASAPLLRHSWAPRSVDFLQKGAVLEAQCGAPGGDSLREMMSSWYSPDSWAPHHGGWLSAFVSRYFQRLLLYGLLIGSLANK